MELSLASPLLPPPSLNWSFPLLCCSLTKLRNPFGLPASPRVQAWREWCACLTQIP